MKLIYPRPYFIIIINYHKIKAFVTSNYFKEDSLNIS